MSQGEGGGGVSWAGGGGLGFLPLSKLFDGLGFRVGHLLLRCFLSFSSDGSMLCSGGGSDVSLELLVSWACGRGQGVTSSR